MSDQTYEPVPAYSLQGEDPPHGGSPAVGVQVCPNCGAENHTSATVCHACGEHLRQRPKNIRCRQCGQRASSSLTICPNCGRELQAAPSRFWLWIVPAGVGLLLLLFWFSRMNDGSFTWFQQQMQKGTTWISGMGEELAPELTMEMTPVVEAGVDLAGVDIVQLSGDVPVDGAPAQDAVEGEDVVGDAELAVAMEPTDTPEPEPSATPLPPPTATPTDEPTAQPSPTSSPVPSSTATPTRKPTEKPSSTVTATSQPTSTLSGKSSGKSSNTPTAASTEPAADDVVLILQPTVTVEGITSAASVALVPTATATATPTAAPRTYDVQAGDTLLSIASRFGISVDALMAANNIASSDVLTLRIGERLIVPNVASADGGGQGGPVEQVYTVRAGDTFVGIAGRFDLTVEELRVANGLTAEGVRLLRPGQDLVIPSGDATSPAPVPTATATKAAATPVPTATPIPTATKPLLRLEAPVLYSPENNTHISCQSAKQLAWSAVDFILPTDEYVMHLGFVSGTNGADEIVTWVLHQTRPSNRTSWEMDNDLCGLAPQTYGRQWRWYVDVADEEATTVSRPSQTWGFSWN